MYGKIQESGLTEIIPFMCISAAWGQHTAFVLSAHLMDFLQPHGCHTTGIVLLPDWPRGLESLMTVASLFIDKAGNT